MKWEKFGNRFRKDARQQEVDVDMNAIWDALEPEVDALNKEEPRRRRFLFWILFTGMLIAGASWLVLSERGQQNDTFVENEKTTQTNNQESITSEENLSSIPSLDKKENLETKEEVNERQSDENQYSNNQKINQQEDQFSNIKSENIIPSLRNNREADQANLKSNQKTIPKKSESPKVIAPTFFENKVIANNKNANSDIDLKEAKKEIELAITPKINPPSDPLNTEKEFFVLPSRTFFLTIEEKNISSLDQFEYVTLAEKSDTDNLSPTPTAAGDNEEEKKYKISAGVYGGASLINRSLKAKNQSANTLLENRNKYETPLEAVHYGFKFGVERSGIRFSLGIQNTTIAERYNFNETQVTLDSILDVKTLLLNFTGDTIPVLGMIPETTTVKNQIRIHNTYKMVDIPISIGYHHSFKEKWSAGIDATIITNISLKTKGIISGEQAEEVDIKTAQNNIFKSKVGLSYQLGLSIGHTFSDKVELNFSPIFRFFPNDFSVGSYNISQKYILIGGNVGLNYRF